MTAALELEDLAVHYQGTGRDAIEGVSLTVEQGEILCIVGESGSGKSTLALASLRLLGREATVSGTIRIGGRDLLRLTDRELRALRGAEVGFVYQDALSAFSPLWTVGDQIVETIRAHEDCSKDEAFQRTIAQLAAVRLPDPERMARSYPHELSGGQRQRAALAMALVLRPRLLIADEPTSALDVTTGAHLLALLKELQREMDLAVLLITHDMHVVQMAGERVAVMYAGSISEVGECEPVLSDAHHPYTVALMASLDLERPRGTLGGVPGSPPGLTEEIVGCRFAARCQYAAELCRVENPEPRQVGASVIRCHFPLNTSVVEAGARADS
jgi:oligopeptide/dipeptide ABC transporter ATP-binding protein